MIKQLLVVRTRCFMTTVVWEAGKNGWGFREVKRNDSGLKS